MRIIKSTCGRACPVVAELRQTVAELRHDVANRNTVIIDLEEKLRVSELRTKRLVDSKRESEKRIAKIRQAAFGVVDWGIDVE